MSRRLLVMTCVFLLFTGKLSAQTEPARVVFLSPDDSRFWGMVGNFMQAVADDLPLSLEVVTDPARHRLSYLQLAKDVLSRPQKPDYLVFMFKEHVSEQMLGLAEQSGVKVFTFNTELPKAAVEEVGLPRQWLPNWLGHLVPDNVDAGERLAFLLKQQASGQGLVTESERLPVFALTGTHDSSAAKDRNLGLLRAFHRGAVQIEQLVAAEWSTQEAERTEGSKAALSAFDFLIRNSAEEEEEAAA